MAVQVCSDRTTMIMLIECWQWHGEQSPRYLHSAIRSSILSQQNVSAEWLNWPLLDTQEPEAPLCHITWANAHDLLLLYLVVSCLWIFLRKKKAATFRELCRIFYPAISCKVQAVQSLWSFRQINRRRLLSIWSVASCHHSVLKLSYHPRYTRPSPWSTLKSIFLCPSTPN